jgi:dipeptidyl aminopeptidase/acylaminoacyl peptidase
VADINYGGSTGYGRQYRQRLNGKWGIVDVDDCCNAAKYLAEKGLVDPTRLCITGGSAGGYTTLACMVFRCDLCVVACALVRVNVCVGCVWVVGDLVGWYYWC